MYVVSRVWSESFRTGAPKEVMPRGVTRDQALHDITWGSAYSAFAENDRGTIEPGKLADIIVMDKNPLENIRNTESISYTMVNGRLYDAEQLNEIGNYNKPRTKFYWELSRNIMQSKWHAAADADEDNLDNE